MYADSEGGFRGDHLSARDENAGFQVQRRSDGSSGVNGVWRHDMYDVAQREGGPIRRGVVRVPREVPYARRGMDIDRAPPRTTVTRPAGRTAAVYDDVDVPTKPRVITSPHARRMANDVIDVDTARGRVAQSSRTVFMDSNSAHAVRLQREEPQATPGNPFANTWQGSSADAVPVERNPLRTTRALGTGLGAAITILNLAPDLDESDVNRLCANYGRSAVTNFAKSTRSCSAEVTFASRADAVKAVRELQGNELDGDGHILECYLGKSSGKPEGPRLGHTTLQR
eukprot:EG_transcript_18482